MRVHSTVLDPLELTDRRHAELLARFVDNVAIRVALADDDPPPAPVDEPERLRTVCAWCPTYDRTDPANQGPNVSHGICDDCAARILAELDELEGRAA